MSGLPIWPTDSPGAADPATGDPLPPDPNNPATGVGSAASPQFIAVLRRTALAKTAGGGYQMQEIAVSGSPFLATIEVKQSPVVTRDESPVGVATLDKAVIIRFDDTSADIRISDIAIIPQTAIASQVTAIPGGTVWTDSIIVVGDARAKIERVMQVAGKLECFTEIGAV